MIRNYLAEDCPQTFWLITGQWVDIIQPKSTLATAEDPNPTPKAFPRMATEFVDMHPSKYVILCWAERTNYAIVETVQINAETYHAFLALKNGAQNGNAKVDAETLLEEKQ